LAKKLDGDGLSRQNKDFYLIDLNAGDYSKGARELDEVLRVGLESEAYKYGISLAHKF